MQKIHLRKVRVHNLQAVDLELEPNQLICFTGISGSGKSSLAFDTLYMEGQRRYVESLSSHVRHFLSDITKPDLETATGISPTISIEQKTAGKNPRSTVGIITEIYDFMRILFARISIPHCPVSGEAVSPRSIEDIIDDVLDHYTNRKIIILAPYIRGKKGDLRDDIEEMSKKGFTRARIDGHMVSFEDDLKIKKSTSHDVDIIIDRIEVIDSQKQRLRESIVTALELGAQTCIIVDHETQEEQLFSTRAFSPRSGISYPPLDPHDFSFNSPHGMCKDCQGMGVKQEFILEQIFDVEKSISEDCCSVASSYNTVRYKNIYDNLARIYDFDVQTPWKEMSQEAKNIFLYGTEKKWTRMHFVHPTTHAVWSDTIWWRGVLHEAYQRYIDASSESYKRKIEKFMTLEICSSCKGARIHPYAKAALFHGKSIAELCDMTIQQVFDFFSACTLKKEERLIGEEIVKEIQERLQFLLHVGLEYLQLSRRAPTLSGGEAQRVRLASQIGSGLVGVTYVLDEPSIGLHPRDNKKLIESLKKLRDKGNTVIVVEHDEETIRAADHVVDFGPGAGVDGGRILVSGTFDELLASKDSLTGQYLSRKKQITTRQRRPISTKSVTISGCTHHNLKNIDLTIPLGNFVAVTGVSGSGKSSLILETLYPALHNVLLSTDIAGGLFKELIGIEHITKVIDIDQSPIGRTPRSNPATYISLFDDIRDLFSQLPESKAKGFKSGRFSFNVQEGSCTECRGMGMMKIPMDFLEDSYVTCPVCEGKRFDEETLRIRYKEKNIQDILSMDVDEALQHFSSFTHIQQKLLLLKQVGLHYLQLGQSSTTLSGGEAQRIKLAKELVKSSTGKTVYILDEPTTGLHFHDINNLLDVLHALVDKGNTVIVIEHNMDVVKTADYVIDLGPGSGSEGGYIIQAADPETISHTDTATGTALREAAHLASSLTPNSRTKHTPDEYIRVTGAQQNNLKKVSCSIPHNRMTCVVGPSGAGKSSLVFDTIYAEGQRRYVDSLSPYIRQFVKQLPKPKIEKIDGLKPSIALEQRIYASNPRSTVGTMTEIYDYLRIIYSRLGVPHCPKTGYVIKAINKETIVDKLLSLDPTSKLVIMAPIAMKKSSNFFDELKKFKASGFLRIRLNGQIINLDEMESAQLPTNYKQKQDLSLVIDRLSPLAANKTRIFEAIRVAAQYGNNKVHVLVDEKELFFNLSFAVEETGESYPEITPKTFAFNTQEGMCDTCQGIGSISGFTLETHDAVLSKTPHQLLEILTSDHKNAKAFLNDMQEIYLHLDIDPYMPIMYQSKNRVEPFFYGLDIPIETASQKAFWRGINSAVEQAFMYSDITEEQKSSLLELSEKRCCPSCDGSRLNSLARGVILNKKNITQASRLSLKELRDFISHILQQVVDDRALIEALDELQARIGCLIDIGLGYLSIDREASTLSGGEEQRVRLARQLGSGLTQVLYILDEPTRGLHPKDIDQLLPTLKKLQALDNTVIIVEHDEQVIRHADHIIQLGPGSGIHGGTIVENYRSPKRQNTSNQIKTSQKKSRKTTQEYLSISNAAVHNLKNIFLDIPLNKLVTLTGVSGSGKSTLLFDVILKELEDVQLHKKKSSILSGYENIQKIAVVDQKPMGHTSRSDVATYLELSTHFRHFFAQLPEARKLGLNDAHFSYYARKGMCRVCQGMGYKRVSLHFLPTVHVTCSECRGYRLRQESLLVKYQMKHLGEILQLSAAEVKNLFHHDALIVRLLNTLCDVGLEYLSLSQEMHTLSSGEAQRMKLAHMLTKRYPKNTLFLLDEPTTGLHPNEVEKILYVLHRLVEQGHSVIAIEHNLDFINNSDWIVDVGPGADQEGGTIVTEGTPTLIAKEKISHTGQYLHDYIS